MAQTVYLRPAAPVAYPAPAVDGNSPGVWVGGSLRVYTSTGEPMAMSGGSVYNLSMDAAPVVEPRDHYPIWIESAWADTDGTVYAWYHHEPSGVCSNNKLTAPVIGALVSQDGGRNFRDLGIILSSGYALDCAAQNQYFAGGHGDFSVILDRHRKYFYFLFGNYSGPSQNQGIGMARMAFQDRAAPVGAVRKYYQGAWTQPGVGGFLSPIFRVAVPWERSNTDALWGPAIHWNTHLRSYVVAMNRSCCAPGWPQEGIYVSWNANLAHPAGWRKPTRLLSSEQLRDTAGGYYPQLVGVNYGESDTLAGQIARLYVKGISRWDVLFLTQKELSQPPTDAEPESTPDTRIPSP